LLGFSEIHIQPINAQCSPDVEFPNVKPGGRHSNHGVQLFVNVERQ